MALTYIRNGRVLDYVPTADVEAGTAVKVGAFVGVTNHKILASEVGGVELGGIYSIPTATSATFAVGAIVYIDSTGKAATTGSYAFGYAVEASANGEVVVRLVPELNAILTSTASSSSSSTGT